MEKVIYSNKQGLGIILNSDELESDFFNANEFKVCNQNLIPGTYTDLFGMFYDKVRFVGSLKDDSTVMCFHLGNDTNLFESKSYYSCFYYISEYRILNKYKEHTARDYNFINRKWK